MVKNIADVLDGQEPLCVWVDGPAGVGKTEVCKRVYAILKSRHSNFAMPYIDITGVSSLPAFFNAVAEGIKKPIPNHIGIDAAPNQLIEILKERRPTDTAFRTLYFDNWEDIWYGLSKQEEKDLLVNWMRTLLTNGFKLLVSSREVAPAVLSSHIFHVFPLDNAVTWTSALPKEKLNSLDSVKLFRSILVRDIIDTEWDSFVSLICQLEGHPLAIVLTATQAQCEISLNNLLHRWDKAKQDTVGIHKEHKNLEIALQVSWNAICSNQEAVMQWGLHYYSLKPIPEDVFLKLRGDCSEEAWQEGSRILMGANLTYATQNREAISMLLPLKKQFNRLSAADKEVREACLIRWAEYIKNLLLFANQRLSADRQIWHHKTIEFLPQIFCVIEQLMVCRTGLTNRYLDLISMKIRNYFQFSIQSLSLLKKLVDYYAKLNHPFLPYFLIDRGDLLSMLGDPDGAIAAYDSAEPLFRQERNNLGLANLLRSRGDLLSMLGHPNRAMAAYDEAESLFHQERDNLGLANLLRSRGDLLSMLGDSDGAMAAYDSAEPLFRQERDNLGLANLLISRGDLLSTLGDPNRAMVAYDNAEPLFRQERDNLGLANLLISRGELLSTLGDPNRAMAAYDSAEPLFRQERDNLGLANLLISRGNLLSMLGDLDGAMAAYDSAEPLFRHERDNLGLANLLRSRGDLLSMLGDSDGAMAAYDSAEPLFRQECNNWGMANLLKSRGDLLSKLDDLDGAMAAYDSAEPLFRHERNNLGLANLLKLRGDLLKLKKEFTQAYLIY